MTPDQSLIINRKVKDNTHNFSDLKCGAIFYFNGNFFMRVDEAGKAVRLSDGILCTMGSYTIVFVPKSVTINIEE